MLNHLMYASSISRLHAMAKRNENAEGKGRFLERLRNISVIALIMMAAEDG